MGFFSAFVRAKAEWFVRLLDLLGHKQTTTTTREKEAQHNHQPKQALEAPLDYLTRNVAERERTEEEIRQHEQIIEARLRKRIRQLESAVAELQKNNRRLRNSERIYRSLVQENISDIITVIGADGTVRLFESPAIERVLGHLPKDQVGTDAFSWLHPSDVEQALNMFAEVLQTPGQHPPIEFGHRVLVASRVFPYLAGPTETGDLL